MKAAPLTLMLIGGFACARAGAAEGRFSSYLAAEAVTMAESAPKGKVSLIAFPETKAQVSADATFPVVLSNGTNAPIYFPSCGTALSIVQEALDAHGKWKPIEREPRSWCGNSYFPVELKPGQAWSMVGTYHSGSFKTKLRFKLMGEKDIYSNEFDGGIDLKQFILPKTTWELIQEADKLREEEEQKSKQSEKRKKP